MPMLHYICIAKKFLTGSHHHFLLELTSCSSPPIAIFMFPKYAAVRQIQSIIEKGDSTMLALNSCYSIKNAFHTVTFADVERGSNGSTPAERLHWFLIGLANLSKMHQSRSANARSRATRSIPYARCKSTKCKHPPGTSTSSSSDEDDDEEDDEEDPSPDFFYQTFLLITLGYSEITCSPQITCFLIPHLSLPKM
jgi:hypothetical protein